MKLIIFILCSFIWLNGFSQKLQSNPWRIDRVIGSDTSKLQEITLQKVDTTKQNWVWGNTLRFFSNGNFKSQYSAKCGNDCFPSSNGSYKFSDSSHVTIFLKEYIQEGDCEHIYRTIEKTIGTYLIVSMDDKTIKLVKLNE